MYGQQPQSNVPHTELAKGYLVYCPPQCGQQFRPLKSSLTQEGVRQAIEATMGGSNLSQAAFNEVAGNLLAANAVPQAQAEIDGGFNSPRYAFMIEMVTSNLHGCKREILTGFTNYMGVDVVSNAIDPKMNFHLNGITLISDTTQQNHTGTFITSEIDHSSNVLVGRNNIPDAVSLSPSAVIGHGQVNHYMGDMADGASFGNHRIALTNTQMTNLTNNIPSTYLQQLVNSQVGAIAATGNGWQDRDKEQYQQAKASCRDANPTAGLLYQGLGRLSAADSHTFTFEDLEQRWPNREWLIIKQPEGQAQVSAVDRSLDWNNSLLETGIVYSLTHALPGILSKFFLMDIYIEIHNETADGSIQVIPGIYHEMFPGYNSPQRQMQMCQRIESELCRGVIKCNPAVGSFNVRMKINLLNESEFVLRINNGPWMTLLAPMFCNSYSSPMTGLSQDAITPLVQDTEFLVGEICAASGIDRNEIVTQVYENNNPHANPFDTVANTIQNQAQFDPLA